MEVSHTLKFIKIDSPIQSPQKSSHEFSQELPVQSPKQSPEKLSKNDIPKSLNGFLRKAHRIHGTRYDYSGVKKSHFICGSELTKIPIRCTFCQYEWICTIYQHLISKWGCPNCSGLVQWDLMQFLQRGSAIQSLHPIVV